MPNEPCQQAEMGLSFILREADDAHLQASASHFRATSRNGFCHGVSHKEQLGIAGREISVPLGSYLKKTLREILHKRMTFERRGLVRKR
jgi:hypothetical protein